MNSAISLKRLLTQSGIVVEADCMRRLLLYLALLQKWNSKVNLTASLKWPALGLLFAEGVWASRFYPAWAVEHLDIGSGAGFPALLLKTLVPQIRLQMVESRAKRAAFLETVIQELGLSGAQVFNCRLQEHLQSHQKKWDCISWKGLKLGRLDLIGLQSRAHGKTEFWIFHGKEAAVKDPRILDQEFQLLRRESFPRRREWALSIYRIRSKG